MSTLRPDEVKIDALLRNAKTIAVVGASADPRKPSHQITKYLLDAGYTVFPVNPKETEILGQTSYPDLASVPASIDIVDVFRRAEHTPEVVRAAVDAGAHAVWLQLGISNEESRALATEAGLEYVEDKCIKIEHTMLEIPTKTH
ncbi:CoA-binding protein [Humidisolicoccus flavus]|uniref:CoA-binding protein n=1 Tax=Humidisolicoccus flavus TaxID=3111414 RepID=UPI0032557D77